MKVSGIAGICAVASILAAGPASAELRVLTITGVAGTNGGLSDPAGLFGPQDDIAGEQFVIQMFFDSAAVAESSDLVFHLGQLTPETDSTVTPLHSTLTIRGITVDSLSSGLIDINHTTFSQYIVGGFGFGDFIGVPQDAVKTSFNDDAFYNSWDGVNTVDLNLGGTYAPSTLDTLRIASAVPEPETWAFMIFGLFGAGSWLRRRQLQIA